MACDVIGVEEAVKDGRHNFFRDAHPGILDADANLIPFIDHINVYIPPIRTELDGIIQDGSQGALQAPGVARNLRHIRGNI